MNNCLPTVALKPRRSSLKIKEKIAAWRAARALKCGCILAHPTGTVAGIAAAPQSLQGIRHLQRFKQRKQPFLLLADSTRTALAQARYIPSRLRHMAKKHWAGSVTLVFPAKPKLHAACYARGKVAVRVDADASCRYLAKQVGGLLLSSSLNRKGKSTLSLQRAHLRHYQRYHIHRFASSASLHGRQASRIYQVSSQKVQRLR